MFGKISIMLFIDNRTCFANREKEHGFQILHKINSEIIEIVNDSLSNLSKHHYLLFVYKMSSYAC